MKKLIYLLPLLIFTAGCVKTNIDQPTPLVPYGTFTGKFTRTYVPTGTNSKATATTNVKLVMTTSGFTVISDAEAVHANSTGEFLGNELSIEFGDTTYPAAGPPNGKSYLHGVYSYAYDGSSFRVTRQSGDDIYDYQLTKN
jgi:hypothetical protein